MGARFLLVGGSSEIGLAIVRELLTTGDQVCLAGRPSPALSAAAETMRRRGLAVYVCAYDASWDEDATRELVRSAADSMDGLDVVVVAVGALGSAGEEPHVVAEADLSDLVTVNFRGPALVANESVALMAAHGSGTLVMVSTVAALNPRLPILGYSAAKAGLDTFVLGLARRAETRGVHCLVVRPGRVRTRMSAGSPPAPFTVGAEAVASAVRRALRRGQHVVWVPRPLGALSLALRLTPRRLLPPSLR
jgi:decaprenylphospho-beta-D-erythro-pentofuranosid-2-ulose 2-reductase